MVKLLGSPQRCSDCGRIWPMLNAVTHDEGRCPACKGPLEAEPRLLLHSKLVPSPRAPFPRRV